MKLLQSFITSPLAGTIGWTLLHSLWEGAVIAGVFGAALIALRSARARYIAACAAMLATLAAFGVTLLWMMPEGTHSMPVLKISAVAAWTAPAVNSAPLSWEMRLAAAVPWLAPFWILGVLLVYLRRLLDCTSVRKLRRRGVCCAPDRWKEKLIRLSAHLRISRPVGMLESCLAEVPTVLGHFRPLILMPVGLLAGLPPGQIEAILLHELAHIRRHDYLVNVLQRFMEGLFFYHPAVWWFSRVMRAERENCCDDIVVSIRGNPHEYALALAVLEQNRLGGREEAVALTGGNLVKRVRRLLYPRRNGPWAPFLAATLLIATAVVSLAAWQAKPHQSSFPAAQSPTGKTPERGYSHWINGPISCIITPHERAAFLRLTTDQEREQFIEEFWERRNPDPGDPENEAKEEFYRRVAFANRHFAAGISGWKTDRGHVYIAWGPPNEIDHRNDLDHLAQPALGPHAFEAWYYNYIPGVGENVKIVFVDRTGNGDFRFASKLPLARLEESVLGTPIVRSIEYEGLSIPQPIVLRCMEKIGLVVTGPYSQNKVDEAREAIKELYKQRGIAVSVEAKVSSIPPHSVALIFIISKR
jgi:GWxTD domain-containing protein